MTYQERKEYFIQYRIATLYRRRKKGREYAAANKKICAARNKKWREVNREKIKADKQKRYLDKKFPLP